jgi:modulator of FtsH protease
MAFQTQTRANTGSLLGQVLGIVAIGICISAGGAYLAMGMHGFLPLGATLLGFILMLAINATRRNEALSLLLFYASTFLWGVGLGPTIGAYVHAFGPGIVYDAALTTGMGMAALGAIVYATGIDFRRIQGYLMLELLGLVVAQIVWLFIHFVHPQVFSWLILVIFSGLVLVDFARIRAGGDGLTPVQLAVSIYLDAVNIFLAILQIFGGRRSSN